MLNRLMAAAYAWVCLVSVVWFCVNYAQWLGWILVGMQVQALLSMLVIKGGRETTSYFRSVLDIYTGNMWK